MNIDPACGSAGFLISAYKYIEAHNLSKDGNSALTADDKNRIIKNFAGYDISPDMVRLSRVNMYLHGFTQPKINEYDTLTSLDKWDDTYDVVLANPPFMTPKGGIIPHNRYRVSAKRSEVLFVDYIAEHLNPTGRAAVIVPEGIVFQSANAYKELRKYLVDDYLLYAVISLPSGVFNPYSGVKTSILLLDKTMAKQRDSILFVKLNNDGYDLGAQRREIKGSEIPDVISVLQDYQNGISVEGRPNVTLADKKAIAERDYILVGDRYIQSAVTNSKFQLVALGDVCEFDRQLATSDKGIYVGMEDIESNTGRISPACITGENKVGEAGAYTFSERHILYGRLRPYLNKVAIPDFYGRCSTELIPIMPNKKIEKRYLALLLRSQYSIDFAMGTNTGARMPRTDMKAFLQFPIPLPPLSVQEEIVAEIESYLKVIDGARQVVENYNPTITLNPEWEIIKLGDVCETSSGGTPKSTVPEYYMNGTINWLKSGEVSNGYIYDTEDKITEKGMKDSSAKLFPVGTVLVAMYGATVGQVGLLKVPSTTNQAVCGILPNEKYIPEFLYFFLKSKRDYFVSISTGGAQPNISQTIIKNLQLPLPSLEEQQKIALLLSEEITIIEQNKRLITIFEQKINDRISEVWGESGE